MSITGVWVYLGRGGITRSRATELRSAGVRGVIVCTEAVDGWRATTRQAAAWGAVCAAARLDVAAYAFPGVARVDAASDIAAGLLRVLREAGGHIPIADVEAPYRARPSQLVRLLDAITDDATDEERRHLGVTTLGLPSKPGRWPWADLLAWMRAHPSSWLGWQCYERAGVEVRVDAGIAELRAALASPLDGSRDVGRVVPHVATYERDTQTREGQDGPARLVADLDRACLDGGALAVSGVGLWSAASLDDAELSALRGWIRRAGW